MFSLQFHSIRLQVVVDIAAQLATLRMDDLPVVCQPPACAVNDLATRAKELHENGKVARPFVYVKLVDWIPHFAKETGPRMEDGMSISCLHASLVSCPVWLQTQMRLTSRSSPVQ